MKLTGSKELLGKLSAMAADVQGPMTAAALEAGALIVENAAKQNVKSQGLWVSGDFARRIDHEITG
jgi:hypothetical protein